MKRVRQREWQRQKLMSCGRYRIIFPLLAKNGSSGGFISRRRTKMDHEPTLEREGTIGCSSSPCSRRLLSSATCGRNHIMDASRAPIFYCCAMCRSEGTGLSPAPKFAFRCDSYGPYSPAHDGGHLFTQFRIGTTSAVHAIDQHEHRCGW